MKTRIVHYKLGIGCALSNRMFHGIIIIECTIGAREIRISNGDLSKKMEYWTEPAAPLFK